MLPLTKESPSNIYPFTFFDGGMPKRMFVDEKIPVYQGTHKMRPAFAHLGKDGSFWAPLFEKAWAKFNGNYDHIGGGHPGEVIAALTGAPYKQYQKEGADA